MQRSSRSTHFARPSLAFVLLCLLLAALWVAGGASRAGEWGQAFVRAAAWAALVVAVLFDERSALRQARPVAFFLLGAVVLVAAQLVPLSPSLWQMLPGREVIAGAPDAALAGGWRPWALVPGATLNALSSLIVPVATLWLVLGLRREEHAWLVVVLLALVAGQTFVGLLQFSGARFDNPLVNDTVGAVSGMFANRNHLALFLAMGCLLAAAWAFGGARRRSGRALTVLGLVLLFLLTILATGSRTGLLLGGLALVVALILSRQGIAAILSRYPRWVHAALVGGVLAFVAIFVLLSFAADRAVSIDRMLSVDSGQDMRTRGFPTLIEMLRTYFPWGYGVGGFDPAFRIHEPFALLKPTYFNHAHNDFLEIALDAGLPGILLLLTALGWWAWASVRAWRSGRSQTLPRLGSAMLLLVIVASTIDYPARTPMIMAVVVIAAAWLSAHSPGPRGSPLPRTSKQL